MIRTLATPVNALVGPATHFMCDLGSRIARWMGGLNAAAEALIGPDTRGVDPDVRF
jgi:hypothetical protein